ncbi:MAG: ATP-binding protein [Chloroflexi bacterium]|nr:ATP-binding protein [Chloroflexota bacterium]
MTNATTPKWLKAMQDAYQDATAHAFLLHFNVRDYTVSGDPLNKYLTKIFAKKEIVAFFSLRGFSFPLDSMRQKFTELVIGEMQQDAMAGLAAARSIAPTTAVLPSNPAQALPLIDKALREGENIAVIINDADLIWPEADTATIGAAERKQLATALYWGMDREVGNSENILAMTTTSLVNIHSQLRAASSRYMALEIPLPDEDERLSFIRILWKKAGENLYKTKLTPEAFARLSAGLSLIHIEDAHFEALREGTLSRQKLSEVKQRILAAEYAEVIELVEPDFGFEAVGGLNYLQRFFKDEIISPVRDGRLHRVPKGVLMIGPPGTGKSLIAKAVAKEAGINMVFFNLARILGQYVGNSERNLERAIRAMISLAPTIVFIDEVDQTVSRSTTGTSGVDSRIFKRLLEVMGDDSLRGKLIFLMASNRPDLMDSAFKRDGRVDAKILVPPPDTAKKRTEIITTLAEIHKLAIGNVPDKIAQNTEGWTGANLASMVRKAQKLVEDEGLSPDKALLEAPHRLIVNVDNTLQYIEWALHEINDLDYVPDGYRDMARKLAQKRTPESEQQHAATGSRQRRDW